MRRIYPVVPDRPSIGGDIFTVTVKDLLRSDGKIWKSRDEKSIRVYFDNILSLVPLKVEWRKPGDDSMDNIVTAKFRGDKIAPLEASKLLSQVDAAILYFDCNARKFVFRDLDGLREEIAKNLKKRIEKVMNDNAIDFKTCPSCKSAVFNINKPSEYAISRKDNKTKVCVECGQLEAFEDHARNEGKVANMKHGKKNKSPKEAPPKEVVEEQPEEVEEVAAEEAKEEQSPAPTKKKQVTEFAKKYEINGVSIEISDARDSGWHTTRVTLQNGKHYVDRWQTMNIYILFDANGKDHWSRRKDLAEKLITKLGDCMVIPLTPEAANDMPNVTVAEKPAKEKPAKAEKVEKKAPKKSQKKDADPDKKAGKKDKKNKHASKDDGKDLTGEEQLCFGCDEVPMSHPPGKCALAKVCTKADRNHKPEER